MHVVLSIDAGTHAVKVFVFEIESGKERFSASEPLPLSFPRPGWVEIDPTLVAAKTVCLLREALGWARRHRATVTCIGLTNMRETAFVWGRRDGVPAHPAIMWMSRQSQPIVEQWEREGLADLIRSRTGLMNHSFFFGSKAAWLLDQRPDLRALAEQGELASGTLDCWLLDRLTGGAVHATDVSNGSRYQLMDLRALCWDEELCDRLGVPVAALPRLAPTSGELGLTAGDVLGAELPITGMIADQQASLFGHGCEQAGDVKITFGTSGVVSMTCGADAPLRDGLVTSVAWSRSEGNGAVYELEGSAFHCGYTVDWLNQRLHRSTAWSEPLEDTPVAAEDAVYILPAFSELGAPRWPRRQGAVVSGLRMDTTNEDILRAAVDAMVFQAYDLYRAMADLRGKEESSVKVDGGGAANPYLCQMLADLLGCEVIRPSTYEVTALGAAKAALIGAGRRVDRYFGQDPTAVTSFQPRHAAGLLRARYDRWCELVQTVLGSDQNCTGRPVSTSPLPEGAQP
jgi:glycerol kinase